ncbi:GNAT family N-acetyltransferase [Paenibacillus allorhizosphaerae]|uniref:N-acetyltransferase domain-containing protein n=1 Tax=Paenibacillus allorhizosphaerae TaxID=2849866 RepID=A0ABN7TY81_9BACL|nr:GNAT family N-acetyltransferase [Paenibacillus allorhizosphaerae]CAG7657290.1 hypothetical protein PAECIP111802_06682 [Paenibacillus allorhizosphaerae]
MNYTIRNVRLPDDYRSIARVLNSHLSEPTTPERLEAENAKISAQGKLTKDDAGFLTGFDRLKLVAEDREGHIVGYGISWRAPWTPAGELHHTLVVEPKARKQGAGGMLYERMAQWALEVGASQINYTVKDNDPDALRFAETRGFRKIRYSFESVLDLRKRGSASSLDAGASFLEAQGIRLMTLSQFPGEASEQKLYALYCSTTPDIPGYRESTPVFREWRKWTLELPGAAPEHVLLAVAGDRWVGAANLLYQEETNSFYHEYTGVERDFRGKGVATALKREAIRLARKAGARYLRTNNDSMNEPMLRINRDKLGYVSVPGFYRMEKRLTPLET